MPSGKDFVQYVADQVAGAGEITYRKMFGEYGMYCDGKIFALICDDQLFIKTTEAGREFAHDAVLAPPYKGASLYLLIENVENRDFLTELVIITCEQLPPPKPKKPRKPKAEGMK